MLVLSRHVGESIMIGDDIEVIIRDVNGLSLVKIGIKAPAHIAVHRKEIYEQIKTDTPGPISSLPDGRKGGE